MMNAIFKGIFVHRYRSGLAHQLGSGWGSHDWGEGAWSVLWPGWEGRWQLCGDG